MSLKWTIIIYISWLFLHYAAAHAYTYFCVPLTWRGILASPFTVPTFHCTSLRWMIYTGGNKMISMWFFMGAYILEKIKNRNINYEGRVG